MGTGLTGEGPDGLGGQVDGGVAVGAPAHAVLGADLVHVGLGPLQVLNQQHALLRVIDLHRLSRAHGL